MINPFRPDGRLAARLRLARGALLWERIWPAAWPAAVRCSASSRSLALFDLLPALPGIAHAGVLALFGLAFAAAVVVGRARGRAVGAVARRGRGAAPHRAVERAGAPAACRPSADRPSGPLDDEMAGCCGWRTSAAWRQAVRRLRVGWPIAGVARRDPWGVRSVLAILLLLAAIDAGADWRDRAGARLRAELRRRRADALAASFDLWLTPPEYTGLAPQFLRAGHGETVQVPTGSVLLGQVHGGSAVPRLAIDGQATGFPRRSTSRTSGSRRR